MVKFIFLCVLICFVQSHPDPVPGYNIEEPLYYDTFPDDFLWGTATAAYQVINDFFNIKHLLYLFQNGMY